MSSARTRERLTFLAIAVIIILLAVNAILLYNNKKQANEISKKQEQLDEVRRLKSELDKEYYEALSEMEEMRGDNEQLNALIDQQKGDLKEQKERIYRLLNENKDLRAAREQLNAMRVQVAEYRKRIQQLEAENAVLVDANERLEGERQLLTREIAEERMAKDELKSEKAELVEAKASLEKEKKVLSETVLRASVIEANNIVIEGMKEKNNDALKSRNRARNVDLLQVCFDASPNDVADKGPEDFYVRIIDPAGNILFNEALGSGIMVNRGGGNDVTFSQRMTIDYDKTGQRACLRWRNEAVYDPGIYAVEIYNKGFLAGTGEVLLK